MVEHRLSFVSRASIENCGADDGRSSEWEEECEYEDMMEVHVAGDSREVDWMKGCVCTGAQLDSGGEGFIRTCWEVN